MRSRFGMCLTSITLTACYPGGRAEAVETADFRLTLDARWSQETHPVSFPPGPHFSGLIGGTHSDAVSFWQVGELATAGIESMAETGSKSALTREVQAAIDAGTAETLVSGGGIGRSPNRVSVDFSATEGHSLLTLVSMIAPSPDWFVGVSGLELRPDGEWIGNLVADLLPYDAGTDSGLSFTSPNDDTNPAEPITLLQGTFPFEDTPPLGTFSILRLLEGDLNESGTHDAGDVDRLTTAILDSDDDPRFDLNGDGATNQEDRVFWVKDLRVTSFGDSSLDGVFNSSDLVSVFQAGEYEDDVLMNSGWATGDWNGDAEFDTGDLVLAFQDGGFENAPRPTLRAIPEPSGHHLLMVAFVAFTSVRHPRRCFKTRRQAV